MAKAAMKSGAAMIAELARSLESAEDGKIWGKIDTKIEHSGKKIVLPADPVNMSYDAAIATIEQVKKDEEQEYDCNEVVQGAPWDSLVAVFRAMQNIYGIVSPQSIQTFFGEIRPDFIAVKAGHRAEDVVMVPQGQMSIPNVTNPITVQLDRQGARIRGIVRRRDQARIMEIIAEARRIIREESVYKGKAIKLTVDGDGDVILTQQPEFLDLSGVREDDIVHNRDVEDLVKVNVFSPLKNTAACRKHKIPLKRGILMSGPYGTGKSLTARVTAKVANDNGWTFIMLNRSLGLGSALELAKLYQPCVIFAEDVDRTADREDEDVNDLVNLLDGVDTKTNEIMVVLTTNFIEHIDKSLLRPGRFDAVISLTHPDAEASQRLIRKYTSNLLDEAEDLSEVGNVVAGMSPAAIREVVERAKLAMLSDDRDSLTARDLRVAAVGMKAHMDLMVAPPIRKSVGDRLAECFGEIMGNGNFGDNEDLQYRLQKMEEKVGVSLTKIGEAVMLAKAGATSAHQADQKAQRILDRTAA